MTLRCFDCRECKSWTTWNTVVGNPDAVEFAKSVIRSKVRVETVDYKQR